MTQSCNFSCIFILRKDATKDQNTEQDKESERYYSRAVDTLWPEFIFIFNTYLGHLVEPSYPKSLQSLQEKIDGMKHCRNLSASTLDSYCPHDLISYFRPSEHPETLEIDTWTWHNVFHYSQIIAPSQYQNFLPVASAHCQL